MTNPTSLFDAARAAGVPFSREAHPADRYVTANGLRFHYLDWGERDRPPVLALHGFAQTAHMWDFAALALCDRYRVIALDQRGHGDSDWAPNGEYSLEDHQQDIHAVVQALDLREVAIMGLSMGGRNAFTYAALHPERVGALVIVDSAPEHERSGSEAVRRFVQGSDELGSFDEFVTRALAYNPRRIEQQVRGSLAHNLKRLPNGKWTWKYDVALRAPGKRPPPDPQLTRRLWEYAAEIRCPTLLVRGEQSRVLSLETAERLASLVSGARLATVEKAGHLVPGDNPAEFQRVLEEFLVEVKSKE